MDTTRKLRCLRTAALSLLATAFALTGTIGCGLTVTDKGEEKFSMGSRRHDLEIRSREDEAAMQTARYSAVPAGAEHNVCRSKIADAEQQISLLQHQNSDLRHDLADAREDEAEAKIERDRYKRERDYYKDLYEQATGR